MFHPPFRASWTSPRRAGHICRTSRIRPRPAPAAKGTRRVRGGKSGGVNRRWVDAHLGVVAQPAHGEVLVGVGVLLVLGLAPLLHVLVLAPDAGAHRVRARRLRGKAESVIGSDRTCKVRTHLLVVALLADVDALLHRLAVVAEQEALGEQPFGGVLGAAPGADVAVASLREEER